ncbi:endolytic transglycosylase MltG [Gryllotalpicola protaetiae]|uniref:Endolytic murein transglycosylase n=2 Tax=Gryllotalpicola protaetiae TaxID=2419771 RepID=A0A387BQJ6_9MICO|nr:endolytic transglycosylase MltG [Gryllotalpicola protaetiae]
MAARAEAEQAAQTASAETAAAAAPEPVRAPEEPAPTGAAVWAAAPVTAQTPVVPGAARPEPQASVAPETDHAHSDFAWLHAATHHHDDDHGGRRGGGKPPKPPRSGRRGRRAATWIISIIVILGLIGGGALYAWKTFQPQVNAAISRFDPQPTDYKGDGTGSAQITIKQGDTGSTIAKTLADAGVTMTPQAFYQLLLSTKPDPVFQPGVYQLRKHMSASAALTLLQDPKSHLEHTLLIREGDREVTVLQNASTATGIPLAQLQASAANLAPYGLPPQAKTLEGFLFPATYTFDPGVTPDQVIAALVNRAKQAFADDGLPTDPTKLWNTVILASIVQSEAGSNPDDLPKIAGVFQNRLNQNMALESDATVTYGLGKFAVFTSDAQRADASNLYNTYAHKGLTPGPIGNPGDAALEAAMNPQGDYLFFTVVNLQTGETAFSETADEQSANVAKLHAWCQDPANKSYCQ